MRAGFVQPSFGQKMSSVDLIQSAPRQKHAGATSVAAPRFGRAEDFVYFDSFHPKPKKKKGEPVIVQVYNGASNPNEKPGLLSTWRKAVQDTIQTAKNIAVLAGVAAGGYGIYRLAPTAIAGFKTAYGFYQGSKDLGHKVFHGTQKIAQKASEGAQEMGKNVVEEVTSPRNILYLLVTAPFLLATSRQMQRR